MSAKARARVGRRSGGTDKRTVVVLVGVVAAVVVLLGVVFATSRGLPDDVVAKIDTELRTFDDAQAQFGKLATRVESALAGSPNLFEAAGYTKAWPKALGDADADLQLGVAAREKVVALKTADRKKDRGAVDLELDIMRKVRAQALLAASGMDAKAQAALAFKRDADKRLAKARADAKFIAGFDYKPLEGQVAKVATDWPVKKGDLARRIATLRALADQVRDSLKVLEVEIANLKGGKAVRLDKLLRAESGVVKSRTVFGQAGAVLKKLTAQLYRSWDKLLVDMEIREGQDVTFFHKYRWVRVQILDMATHENKTTSEERWVKVTESEYKRHEKNLGMTLESKPAGKYDHEATRLVQPPGYSHICDPSQKSNQYGRWENRGGRSYWGWYGRYALMSHLLYGRGYYSRYGVYGNDWRGYRSTSRVGRTYYGATAGRQRFGSAGTQTRASYSSSKYRRNRGYKATRYKTSGGKYRGSRYERRSSSGSGYRGSRSRGSRWGGGK